MLSFPKQQHAREDSALQNNKPLSREFLASRGVCCGNMCANCCYYPRFTAGTTQKY
jgi:hypothetical protein